MKNRDYLEEEVTVSPNISVIRDLADKLLLLERPVDLSEAQRFCTLFRRSSVSIATAEKAFKLYKEYYTSIKNDDLPEEILLTNNKELRIDNKLITVNKDIKVSVSRKNESSLFRKWKQFVTSKFEIVFKKGENPNDFRKYLNAAGIKYTEKKTIHAMTLKAQTKKLLREGRAVPEELSVFEYKSSNIKEE